MTTRRLHLLRPALAGAIAITFAVVPTSLRTPITTIRADPCVNGIVPWNPYVVNCNLPARTIPKVRGAAPDAGAIIACHDKPGCLALYVNGE
ncbi:MAG: hypothetical protein P4L86_20990 [Mycobacterium sp.]|nr:hypothetical protein [Mycobacterium sp.]